MPVRAQYAINMRAVLAVSIADYDAATTLLERSIEMARANNDIAEQAKSLGNLAAVHNFRGFIAQAAQEYEALLPLIDPRAQTYQYAALLGNYGFTLIALGDFDRALALHTEALKLYTKIGEEAERAIELAALGGLYLRMGDAERALQTLRAAIVEHERLADNAQARRHAARGRQRRIDAGTARRRRSTTCASRRKSMRILTASRARACSSRRNCASPGSSPKRKRSCANRWNLPMRWCMRKRSRNARTCASRRTGQTTAIEDLRAADRQYAALGLEFNRIDTNTALSQALLGKR